MKCKKIKSNTLNCGIFLPLILQLLPISHWVEHMGWPCYFLSSAPTHRVGHLAPSTTWAPILGKWGPSVQSFLPLAPHGSPSSSSWFKCSSWRHLDRPPCVKLQLFYHLTLPILLPVLFLSSASSNLFCILLIYIVYSFSPPRQKISSGK